MSLKPKIRLSTGDQRLDALICGPGSNYKLGKGQGLEVYNDQPITVLIKGCSGAGKSTLAGQMAAEYAKKYGCLVPYFALEEYTDAIAVRTAEMNGLDLAYTGGNNELQLLPADGSRDYAKPPVIVSSRLLNRLDDLEREKLREYWRERGGIVVTSIKGLKEMRFGEDDISGLLYSRVLSPFPIEINLKYSSTLNGKKLSRELIEALESSGIAISSDSRVLVEEEGNRWRITDGNNTYIIRKDENVLAIHALAGQVRTEAALQNDLKHLLSQMDRFISRARASYKGWFPGAEDNDEDGKDRIPLSQGLFVIDSLNILEAESKGSEPLARFSIRAMLRNLVQARNNNALVVFEIEDDKTAQTTEEYVSDVVFELGFYESGSGERYFQLVKTRNHNIDAACYPMEIVSGQGVKVWPPLEAILYEESFVEADTKEVKYLGFGIRGLDRQLRHHYLRPKEKSGRGVHAGSLTFVVGPEACRKTYLALAFLGESLRPKEKNIKEKSIYIDLREAEDALRGLASRMWTHYDVAEADVKSYFDHCYKQLPFLPKMPARAFGYIHDFLKDCSRARCARSCDKPLRRVVINDLSVLSSVYSDEEVMSLVRILKQVCAKNGIAALVIQTVADPFNLPPKVFNLADNIILCIKAKESGLEGHVAVQVRRYQGGAGRGNILELFYNRHNGSVAVKPGVFDQAGEIEQGEIGVGHARLYYYSGETSAQKKYARSIARRLAASIVETPLPSAEEYVGRSLTMFLFGPRESYECEDMLAALSSEPPFTRIRFTEVVMFDEPWSLLLKDQLLDLYPLVKWPKWQDDWLQNDDQKIFMNLRDEKSGDPSRIVRGIPYYLNFSCLCYRRDYLRQVRDKLNSDLKALVTENGDLKSRATWADILEIARQAAKHRETSEIKNNTFPLALDLFSPETWACLLLVFCGNELWKSKNGIISVERLIEVIWEKAPLIGELMYGMKDIHFNGPVGNTDSENGTSPRNWVVSCCWNTTRLAWEKYLAREKGAYYPTSLIGYCPIPSASKGGTIKDGAVLSGTWYLGILAHSQNPIRGGGIIRNLVSEQNQESIYQNAVGLPPMPDYRRRDISGKGMSEIVSRTHSRCDIENYLKISPMLSNLAQDIYRSSQRTKKKSQAAKEAKRYAGIYIPRIRITAAKKD